MLRLAQRSGVAEFAQARVFRFGHVRQLDDVASRILQDLACQAPILRVVGDERVMVDLDDMIIEVHGYQKQGDGFGYSGARGLNALIATASTAQSTPVVLAQRLRKGAAGCPRDAARIVADALATVRRLNVADASGRVLIRADSAFYGHATVSAVIRTGADASITVRMDPAVKAAIATITADAWTKIEYTDAIRDEATGQWISKAEVAEVPFFATTSKSTMDTVTVDKTHRGHARIEQVHADLKNGPLAHLPSGVFTANSTWLVLAVIAFNHTRPPGSSPTKLGDSRKRRPRRSALQRPRAPPRRNAHPPARVSKAATYRSTRPDTGSSPADASQSLRPLLSRWGQEVGSESRVG